jgi:hypothetical protein
MNNSISVAAHYGSNKVSSFRFTQDEQWGGYRSKTFEIDVSGSGNDVNCMIHFDQWMSGNSNARSGQIGGEITMTRPVARWLAYALLTLSESKDDHELTLKVLDGAEVNRSESNSSELDRILNSIES